MTVDERKVAILGAGEIGEVLISGLLSAGWRAPAEITASTRREERLEELRERHGVWVTRSNAEAVARAGLVVIAVKAQDIEALLGEIGTLIQPEQVVLSVVAAIPTAAIERHLVSGVPVLRAMPNTPSVVREGIARIVNHGDSPGRLITAFDNGEVVGFSHYENERFGPIGVAASQRGRGLGQVLMYRTLVAQRDAGFRAAWFLWSDDKTAAKLYNGAGFKEVRRFALLRKELI